MNTADQPLLRLLSLLKQRGYCFVTPTPATHARVVARRRLAASVEDIFGWSLPFAPGLLPAEFGECLREAGMIETGGAQLRSLVRVSSLGAQLYLHSAFPTTAEDAVFFGPDSYRFADLIAIELAQSPLPPRARVIDIGCGTGIGAITVALAQPDAAIVMTDINPRALRLASLNAAAAGIAAEAVETSGFAGLSDRFDLAVINPPYIIDPARRAYRDGGGLHGGQLSLALARAAVERLAPGGRLILYTGSAIVNGEDRLKIELERVADSVGAAMRYRELDPDVFGEEIDNPGYEDVDRIALVGAIIIRAG